MAKVIKTTSEVIERLGGIRAVMALTGSTYNAVANWKSGRFPANTYVAITDALAAKKLTAPTSIWAMKVARSKGAPQ